MFFVCVSDPKHGPACGLADHIVTPFRLSHKWPQYGRNEFEHIQFLGSILCTGENRQKGMSTVLVVQRMHSSFQYQSLEYPPS